MLLTHLKPLSEAEDEPLFISMLRRVLRKYGRVEADFRINSGRKLGYIDEEPTTGMHHPHDGRDPWKVWHINLDQKRRPGHKLSMTCSAEQLEDLTLVKIDDDDYPYKVVNKPKLEEALSDEAGMPLWATIIKNGLAKGKKFYYGLVTDAYTTRIVDIKAGPAMVGLVTSVTEKTGKHQKRIRADSYGIRSDEYDRVQLKKVKDGYTLIRDEDVKHLKEEVHDPLIVRLINNRIIKQGAVKTKIALMQGYLEGWITDPLEPEPAFSGLSLITKTQWKCKVRPSSAARGSVKLFYLQDDADQTYTLKTSKDGNGNTVVLLTDREDSDEAE